MTHDDFSIAATTPTLPLSTVLQELSARGLVHDTTDLAALAALPAGTPFYLGIDPTSPFLGIGNLVPLMVVLHLGRAGLQPLLLFGGATGAIGDPSGKQQERPLLTADEIASNVTRHQEKVLELCNRLKVTPTFVNNADWLAPLSLIDFLREAGKHLTVNYMIAKDSVRNRLEGGGISFTEFSYMLLQAHDFAHLYATKGCRIQIGGADQWGNITAGLELIRKKIGGSAHALSVPLLTNKDGVKFGKSEAGSVYLNHEATSPYNLYQFFVNVADEEAVRLLKIFTFIPVPEINALAASALAQPESRILQHRLAQDVVAFVHGEDALKEAMSGAALLFSDTPLSADMLASICASTAVAGVPTTTVTPAELTTMSASDLFTHVGLTPSKAEAKRLAKGGGLYINNTRVDEPLAALVQPSTPPPTALLLRMGKKNYHLVKIG